MLRIFEREIQQKIYELVQEGHIRRIRNNEELNRSINGEDIVKFIKAQRISCLGHNEDKAVDREDERQRAMETGCSGGQGSLRAVMLRGGGGGGLLL